jgi:hypothetical protein
MSSVDLKVGITLQNVDELVDQIVERLGSVNMGAVEEKAMSDSDYAEVKEKMEELLEEIQGMETNYYGGDNNYYYETDTAELLNSMDKRFDMLEQALQETRVEDIVRGGRSVLANVRGSQRTVVMDDMDVGMLEQSTKQMLSEGGFEKILDAIGSLPDDAPQRQHLFDIFSNARKVFKTGVSVADILPSGTTIKSAMKSSVLNDRQKNYISAMQMLSFGDRNLEDLLLSKDRTIFDQQSFEELFRRAYGYGGEISHVDHEGAFRMMTQAFMKAYGAEGQITEDAFIRTQTKRHQLDVLSFMKPEAESLDSLDKILAFMDMKNLVVESKEGKIGLAQDVAREKTKPMFVNALQQIRDGATEEAFEEFIQMINDDPKAFINRLTRNAVLLGEGAAGTMNQTQIADVENSVKEGIKNAIEEQLKSEGIDLNKISDVVDALEIQVLNPDMSNQIIDMLTGVNDAMTVMSGSMADLSRLAEDEEFKDAMKEVVREMLDEKFTEQFLRRLTRMADNFTQ